MASKNVRDAHQDFAKIHSRSAHLPVTTIYVLVVKQSNMHDILLCEDYTHHPIISKNKPNCSKKLEANGDSRLFIDEDGNTYGNWECYKQENKLDHGIMIAPRNGHYSFDEDGYVHLEIMETPATKVSQSPTAREAQQDFANNSKSFGPNCKSNSIYVLVASENDPIDAENSRNFTYHPIIRSKDAKNGGDTFIDEDGNSYSNWEYYKRENKLHYGIMIAPLNGYYSFDEGGRVQLDIWKTPATNTGADTIASELLTIRKAQQNYANIVFEGKETSNTIYILIPKKSNLRDAINSEEFTTHSVIRTDDEITENYYFVDDNGKKYISWDVYRNENKLPEGIMVAPLNGIYGFDENGDVELEVCLTPACTPRPQQTIRNLQQIFATAHKYTKSHRAILHVMVTSKECENVLEATEFTEFCIERYINPDQNGNKYEDQNGNKYRSWNCYLQDNDLPAGKMVAPRNGDYIFDNDGNVELDVQLTPKGRKMRTILEVQQDFANNSAFNTEVIWDLLSAKQCSILKDKIEMLIPDQKKGQKRVEEMRNIIFESVWAQRKYTNGNSLSAIIYVFVTESESEKNALNANEFSCHPVFRTRKCTTEGDSSHCCMIFIDEQGRVYQNWKSYLANNELPAGMMIAPHNGIYTTDHKGSVELDICITPNGTTASKALGVADTATAVAGFGAATVPIAAMMMAVAPPIVLGAATVCATTAVYSTVRSVFNLVDRKKHEQSIGLDNSQARNSWLGVGAGIVGLGATSATKAMTAAATAGREISVVTELVVNGMNISSIVLSGTGVANGILDILIKYRDDEDYSAIEIAQLAASLVLFTHSVSNFRLASTLINETHHSTIQDYRKSLSNRQRKMFDKMSKETIRIRGASKGKVDIIRSVNDMPSKQYLNDLYKVNKDLNKANVRPSFGSAGEGVMLNNDVKIDSKVLRNNIQHKQGPNVLNTVTKPIPVSHSEASTLTSSRLLLSNNNIPQTKLSARAIGMGSIILPNSIIINFSDYGTRLFEIISNADSFGDIVTTLADIYSKDAFNLLMKITQKFVEEKLDQLTAIIQVVIPAESILYRIFVFCQQKYSNQSYEFLSTKIEEILSYITNYYKSMNPNSCTGLQKCDICGGFYSIRNI